MPKECSFFLFSVETDDKRNASCEIFGSKKAGWYDPASPNGNASALPLVFYCVKKAAQGGFPVHRQSPTTFADGFFTVRKKPHKAAFSTNPANESPYLIKIKLPR
jgi:hypothetical protein